MVSGIQTNGTYTFKLRARTSTSSEEGYVGVNFYDANNKKLSQPAGISLTVRGTRYKTYQTSFKVTNSQASKVKIWSWKNNGKGYIFVDNFSLNKQP